MATMQTLEEQAMTSIFDTIAKVVTAAMTELQGEPLSLDTLLTAEQQATFTPEQLTTLKEAIAKFNLQLEEREQFALLAAQDALKENDSVVGQVSPAPQPEARRVSAPPAPVTPQRPVAPTRPTTPKLSSIEQAILDLITEAGTDGIISDALLDAAVADSTINPKNLDWQVIARDVLNPTTRSFQGEGTIVWVQGTWYVKQFAPVAEEPTEDVGSEEEETTEIETPPDADVVESPDEAADENSGSDDVASDSSAEAPEEVDEGQDSDPATLEEFIVRHGTFTTEEIVDWAMKHLNPGGCERRVIYMRVMARLCWMKKERKAFQENARRGTWKYIVGTDLVGHRGRKKSAAPTEHPTPAPVVSVIDKSATARKKAVRPDEDLEKLRAYIDHAHRQKGRPQFTFAGVLAWANSSSSYYATSITEVSRRAKLTKHIALLIIQGEIKQLSRGTKGSSSRYKTLRLPKTDAQPVSGPVAEAQPAFTPVVTESAVTISAPAPAAPIPVVAAPPDAEGLEESPLDKPASPESIKAREDAVEAYVREHPGSTLDEITVWAGTQNVFIRIFKHPDGYGVYVSTTLQRLSRQSRLRLTDAEDAQRWIVVEKAAQSSGPEEVPLPSPAASEPDAIPVIVPVTATPTPVTLAPEPSANGAGQKVSTLKPDARRDVLVRFIRSQGGDWISMQVFLNALLGSDDYNPQRLKKERLQAVLIGHIGELIGAGMMRKGERASWQKLPALEKYEYVATTASPARKPTGPAPSCGNAPSNGGSRAKSMFVLKASPDRMALVYYLRDEHRGEQFATNAILHWAENDRGFNPQSVIGQTLVQKVNMALQWLKGQKCLKDLHHNKWEKLPLLKECELEEQGGHHAGLSEIEQGLYEYLISAGESGIKDRALLSWADDQFNETASTSFEALTYRTAIKRLRNEKLIAYDTEECVYYAMCCRIAA